MILWLVCLWLKKFRNSRKGNKVHCLSVPMGQTYSEMLAKVQKFHDKHSFHQKKYRGHDMAYRILLTMEELGEFAECFTKGKPDSEKAEELADLLILIIGHAIAMKVDLETAFNKKMDKIMKRPAIMGEFGIRVTEYKSE